MPKTPRLQADFTAGRRAARFHQRQGDENACRFPAEAEPGSGRPPKSCTCGAMVRWRPRGRRSLELSCWLAQGCAPRDLLMTAQANARTRSPRHGLIWCAKSWHAKSTLKEGNIIAYLV